MTYRVIYHALNWRWGFCYDLCSLWSDVCPICFSRWFTQTVVQHRWSYREGILPCQESKWHCMYILEAHVTF